MPPTLPSGRSRRRRARLAGPEDVRVAGQDRAGIAELEDQSVEAQDEEERHDGHVVRLGDDQPEVRVEQRQHEEQGADGEQDEAGGEEQAPLAIQTVYGSNGSSAVTMSAGGLISSRCDAPLAAARTDSE